MISHIALLRGINVGGNMLKMERLRTILAELGLVDVKTYLQSGNALLSAKETSARLSAAIEKRLGDETRLPVSVIVRTPAQLKRIVDANPFLGEGRGSQEAARHLSGGHGVEGWARRARRREERA